MPMGSLSSNTSRSSSPDAADLVAAKDLCHWLGEGEYRTQALHDVNLRVAAGEQVLLTGPAGSGRMTFLQLIAGIKPAQQGSLVVLGRQLVGASEGERVRVRRQLGQIFEQGRLLDTLTVRENIQMGTEIAGVDRRVIREWVDELMERFEIIDLGDRMPRRLSDEQRQRAAIVRALAARPKLVVGVEPILPFGKPSGEAVCQQLAEVAEQLPCSLIFASHDNRLLNHATRIVRLYSGSIQSITCVQTDAKIADFLKSLPIFAELTPNRLAYVVDNVVVRELRPGEVLLRQGDAVEYLYVIASGVVDVLREDDAEGTRAKQQSSGDLCGILPLVTSRASGVTVKAHEATVLYELAKESFEEVLRHESSVEDFLRNQLSQLDPEEWA